MKPGSEDEGSKQEAVSEETMEMAFAVVKVTDGMVTAVEMLEYLELESPEEDKVAAARFFSRALAGGDDKSPLPPHSPGLLPGLLQRLKDCIHYVDPRFSWITSDDQNGSHTVQSLAILSINRLIYHYAHILEPTETEMTSLEDAVDALDVFIKHHSSSLRFWKGRNVHHISHVLPSILGIFQEPGKRKKAQIHAASCLASLASRVDETSKLIDSGVMGVMMETLRVGKDSPDVLTLTTLAIYQCIRCGNSNFLQSVLDSGILDAIEEVLKRPNHALDTKCENADVWSYAMKCLRELRNWSQEQVLDAIVSSGGLMEIMLEVGQEMPSDATYGQAYRNSYPNTILYFMCEIVEEGTESQLRRLMSKVSFFRFLAYHLNATQSYHLNYWLEALMDTVKACLTAPGTDHGLWLRRRLIDSSGITDAVRRFSLNESVTYYPDVVDKAHHIFDTYLKDPLPPRPISKLPSIIYTKNAPQ